MFHPFPAYKVVSIFVCPGPECVQSPHQALREVQEGADRRNKSECCYEFLYKTKCGSFIQDQTSRFLDQLRTEHAYSYTIMFTRISCHCEPKSSKSRTTLSYFHLSFSVSSYFLKMLYKFSHPLYDHVVYEPVMCKSMMGFSSSF